MPGEPRKKLVLLDGANTLFRAFFAIPHLRAPDGTPTNAAYGFINTLIKVLREEAPHYAAVVYDAPGKTFRHEAYADYKAGRDATPEDLRTQLPLVRELVEAHRVAWVEVPGFEADDVIAALAAKAPADMDVVIVSTDKDLMQLVSERVTLLDGIKDRRYDPAGVEERFGVPPENILDLRALVGDPSDNIPGVKGIGEKGAAKLIGEWQSLENLLAHASDVKAKRAREALQSQADAARLSKELATLRLDAPLPLAFDELVRHDADVDSLRALYQRLGFVRLVDSLEGGAAAPAASSSAGPEVEIANDVDALVQALGAPPADARPALVAVCSAGSAVDAEIVGLAIATTPEGGVYLPFRHPEMDPEESPESEAADPAPPPPAKPPVPLEPSLDALRRALEGRAWLGSGTKLLQSLCAERGFELPAPAFDAEIAAFLLDSGGVHHVSALAAQSLGRDVASWEDVAGRGAKAVSAEALPIADAAAWAVGQACALAALAPLLEERLESDALRPLFDEVEMPLTRVLSRVERSGVRIDEDRLVALSEEYEKELSRLEAEIYSLAGQEFKVNSPKQLQEILFEKLKLPVIKKTKTGYSTDEGVLEQLAAHHELPGRILAWRRLAKLKSTYIDALPPLVSERTGRIHPVFNQTGAATGRLSASQPNVQNIPIRTEEGVRIREAFVPAEGCMLLSADYSQVELRILAHYSGDESLIDAFSKGEDIHRRTAAEVAGIAVDDVDDEQRARAKAINFGIIYGSSAFGIANQLGIASADAQATIDAYFERYQGVKRFLDETVTEAKQRGFVTTLLGRRRYLPDLGSRNRVLRQAAERMAVNTVIQGSEADLIKKAMVAVDALLPAAAPEARMILQVHDELVFETPKAGVEATSEIARSCMEGVFELRVPLVVDVGVGASWREAH